MLPCNSNVRDGKANGIQATVQKVILKNGETAQHVMLGGNIPVPAALAHHVSLVLHVAFNLCPPTKAAQLQGQHTETTGYAS